MIIDPKETLATILATLQAHAKESTDPNVRQYTQNLIADAQKDKSGLMERVKNWESPEAERMRKVVRAVILLAPYMEKGWPIIDQLKLVVPKQNFMADYLIELYDRCFIDKETMKMFFSEDDWKAIEKKNAGTALEWEGEFEKAPEEEQS